MIASKNAFRDEIPEVQTHQEELQEIMDNMDFQVALLGGSGVGKTSLLRKIISNYVEEPDSDNDSIASISQEMMRHTLVNENNEEVKIVFVSNYHSE